MSEDVVKSKAIAFEALKLLYKGDDERAWNTLVSLNPDFSLPFASYTREFVADGKEETLFNEIWRSVRSAFDQERIPFSVVTEEDYPSSHMEGVHFLYTAGKLPLGSERKLVVVGTPIPSLKAKDDIFNAVAFAAEKGWTIVSPLASGCSSFALSSALNLGASTIAVLSSPISKCPSEALLELMEKVYEKGTLVSQFSPLTKSEKWHVVLRNRFLSSFGDGYFLAEDKDGGPSWPIFDSALEKGRKGAIPKSLMDNRGYSWCGQRLLDKAIPYSKPKDLLKLFGEERSVRRGGKRKEDLTPSLFDGLDAQ